MKSLGNRSRIVLALLALFSIVFLIATYGTALQSTPFSPAHLNAPTTAGSDGELTAIVDTASSRVLILGNDDRLTGVIDCATLESPVKTVIDVCVSGGSVYVAGFNTVPDSLLVEKERVVVYDKGGNRQGTVFELEGNGASIPAINRLSDTPGGVIVSLDENVTTASDEDATDALSFTFVPREGGESRTLARAATGNWRVFPSGCSPTASNHIVLNIRGFIDDGDGDDPQRYNGRVFTNVDVGDDGRGYGCDDASGALCAMFPDGSSLELVEGSGYESVHVNGRVMSICDEEGNLVRIGDADGTIVQELTSISPSIGFTARMMLV